MAPPKVCFVEIKFERILGHYSIVLSSRVSNVSRLMPKLIKFVNSWEMKSEK